MVPKISITKRLNLASEINIQDTNKLNIDSLRKRFLVQSYLILIYINDLPKHILNLKDINIGEDDVIICTKEKITLECRY